MKIVPPGGFAGFSQMTPASQDALTKSVRSSNGPRRRKKAKKSAAPRRRKKAAKRKASSGKGSAAMKRKMARLRKMRKKK